MPRSHKKAATRKRAAHSGRSRKARPTSLGDLKACPHNPRTISAEALAGLQVSVAEFGDISGIVWNRRTGHLVAGHQRIEALQMQHGKQLAITDDAIQTPDGERFPIRVVDWPDEKATAAMIAANNAHIAGDWTTDLGGIVQGLAGELGEAWSSLRFHELQKEAEALGYQDLGAGRTLPDDIPKPPKKTSVRRGDLYQLGEHRLLCGDSTNQDDVARLMAGETAQLFATDPPYLVGYTGGDRPGRKGQKTGKDWSELYHDIKSEDHRRFMTALLSEGLKVSDPNAAIYLWHAHRQVPMIRDVALELGISWNQQIIWVKPVCIPSHTVYFFRHEPCLVGWQKGNKPRCHPSIEETSVWVVGLLRSGDPEDPAYYTDIWEIDWEGKQRPGGVEHPTVKPVEIFARPMRVHTQTGDLCYEPFAGSGSQIIAAQAQGRRCYAMEIEPVFVDVAVRRWEEYTGQKARRLQKGRPK